MRRLLMLVPLLLCAAGGTLTGRDSTGASRAATRIATVTVAWGNAMGWFGVPAEGDFR